MQTGALRWCLALKSVLATGSRAHASASSGPRLGGQLLLQRLEGVNSALVRLPLQARLHSHRARHGSGLTSAQYTLTVMLAAMRGCGCTDAVLALRKQRLQSHEAPRSITGAPATAMFLRVAAHPWPKTVHTDSGHI